MLNYPSKNAKRASLPSESSWREYRMLVVTELENLRSDVRELVGKMDALREEQSVKLAEKASTSHVLQVETRMEKSVVEVHKTVGEFREETRRDIKELQEGKVNADDFSPEAMDDTLENFSVRLDKIDDAIKHIKDELLEPIKEDVKRHAGQLEGFKTIKDQTEGGYFVFVKMGTWFLAAVAAVFGTVTWFINETGIMKHMFEPTKQPAVEEQIQRPIVQPQRHR